MHIGGIIKANVLKYLYEVFAKEINGLGVHGYFNLDAAFTLAWYFNVNPSLLPYNFEAVCFKAEIPPYTPYWIGKRNDVAAIKMRIVEEISEYIK